MGLDQMVQIHPIESLARCSTGSGGMVTETIYGPGRSRTGFGFRAHAPLLVTRAAVEQNYSQGLAIARQQSAKFSELRAAIDLARLCRCGVLTFRTMPCSAVMAFMAVLAALLISIQLQTFDLAAREAASAYMDAASAKALRSDADIRTSFARARVVHQLHPGRFE
jgi:hypothetical protein